MAVSLLLRSLYLLPLFFFLVANGAMEDLFGEFGGEAGQQNFEPEMFNGGSGTGPLIIEPKNFEPEEIKGSEYAGSWELASENSRVSAMHLVLQPPTNQALMFDATVFGPSQMPLPRGQCRPVPGKPNELDCFAHAVQYDTDTGATRPVKLLTNPWCSSGGHAVDGTVVNTGGWADGGKAVRWVSNCKTCDFRDYDINLSGIRWYSTQQNLADGTFILVGGRRMFNYEYVVKEGVANPKNFELPLLRETTDDVENNLYPFVFLNTDGNVFILANNRSVLLNTKTNKVVREFPVLPGGSRNYPASGTAALLPIRLEETNPAVVPAEVIVCGGSPQAACKAAEKHIYMDALESCGRIEITNPNAQWVMEDMPMPRVMSDMLILPTGDLLLINGAQKGVSGWGFADDPALNPVLYKPNDPKGDRFTVLKGTKIARMYHSTSAVLPDGKILVAGSNTNDVYKFTNASYPTELRVEKFWPPYLDPLLASSRPAIVPGSTPTKIKYGENFKIDFTVGQPTMDEEELEVTMLYPPFTTHGFAMNQRMLILAKIQVVANGLGRYQIATVAPATGALAPPGYYLLFVVYRGVPGQGVWIHIQ